MITARIIAKDIPNCDVYMQWDDGRLTARRFKDIFEESKFMVHTNGASVDIDIWSGIPIEDIHAHLFDKNAHEYFKLELIGQPDNFVAFTHKGELIKYMFLGN